MAPVVADGFSVEVRREHQTVIVEPSGELDLASAPALEAELKRVWQSDAELVIIDLRALEFMDSTGLHVIITTHQRAHENGRQFAIVDGGEPVHQLLILSGILDILNVVTAPPEVLPS